MAITTPLVLARLANGQQIADAKGVADPRHIQTLNNAFQNINANVANLAAQETALAEQETATATNTQNVADALQALAEVQGQVAAVQGAQTSQALAVSWTSPAVVLSAATTTGLATITVVGHTRLYGDGKSVAVSGSSFPAPAKATSFWVYYQDGTRTGGAVAYSATTDPNVAVQIAGVHCVGSVYVSTGDATNPGTANYGPGVGMAAAPGRVA